MSVIPPPAHEHQPTHPRATPSTGGTSSTPPLQPPPAHSGHKATASPVVYSEYNRVQPASVSVGVALHAASSTSPRPDIYLSPRMREGGYVKDSNTPPQHLHTHDHLTTGSGLDSRYHRQTTTPDRIRQTSTPDRIKQTITPDGYHQTSERYHHTSMSDRYRQTTTPERFLRQTNTPDRLRPGRVLTPDHAYAGGRGSRVGTHDRGHVALGGKIGVSLTTDRSGIVTSTAHRLGGSSPHARSGSSPGPAIYRPRGEKVLYADNGMKGATHSTGPYPGAAASLPELRRIMNQSGPGMGESAGLVNARLSPRVGGTMSAGSSPRHVPPYQVAATRRLGQSLVGSDTVAKDTSSMGASDAEIAEMQDMESQVVDILTEMAQSSSPAVSIVRDDPPPPPLQTDTYHRRLHPTTHRSSSAAAAALEYNQGEVEDDDQSLFSERETMRTSLRQLNTTHHSRSYMERSGKNHCSILPKEELSPALATKARRSLDMAMTLCEDGTRRALDRALSHLVTSPGPVHNALHNAVDRTVATAMVDWGEGSSLSSAATDRLSHDLTIHAKLRILDATRNMYAAPISMGSGGVMGSMYASEDVSADENESGRAEKRIIKPKIPFGAQSDTDSEASAQNRRKRTWPHPSIQRIKKMRGPSNLIGRTMKPIRTTEVVRKGPDWNPDRLTSDSMFVMGAKANKALGLGATRGRIYTKHPEVFKFTADMDSRQWLQEKHRVHTSGGKAYMFLVEDIQRLAQKEEYRNNSGLLLKELVGFSVPPWLLGKAKQQMESNRTKPTNMHLANVLGSGATHRLDVHPDYNDTDSDRNVPFTSAEGSRKSLSNNKSPSPEEMELMSSDGTTGDGNHGNHGAEGLGRDHSGYPPSSAGGGGGVAASPGSPSEGGYPRDPPPTISFSLYEEDGSTSNTRHD